VSAAALAPVREAALVWLDTHGMPTRKDEDWRYLHLDPILAASPVAAGDGHEPPIARVSTETLAGVVPELGGPRLVFADGHLVPSLSSGTDALPEGLTLTNLATLLPGEPDRFASVPTEEPHDGFAALNLAEATDGAYVHVAAGATVAEPIHLVFCHGSLSSTMRSLIVAEADSRATIVETHVGIDDDGPDRENGPSRANVVTRVFVGERADVGYHLVQDAPESAFHLGRLDAHQAAGSFFTSHAFALGAAIARHEIRVFLEEEGADATLNGLFLPHGDQQHDNPVLVDHIAPQCTSRQAYNGVLDDRGHGVFNGRIVVRPDANGTNAAQSNRNLVLSDRAEIDTRPRLEILADDVKCAHGATVGQLDPEAVHYLRTRGIPETQARGLLTEAFANEMVDLVDLAPLRQWLNDRIATRSRRNIPGEPS
jgi:Fe-S cluster assembly protein SufD